MIDQSFIDYYALLNVPFNASEQEIKLAFRKLAMKYHPDRHPENTAYYNNKFQEIKAAYEVLSHPLKKGDYDWQYRQFVLKEFPEYEYVTDTTAPDTTPYTHVYTRRSKSKIPFYVLIALLILVLQLLRMVNQFIPT